MTREEAIQVLANFYISTKNPKANHLCEAVYIAIQALKNEPKHGHWIEEGFVDGNQNRYCRCSECGKGDTQVISQEVPYCWHCGARMDGGKNEC